jgi:predicted metal-binding protein
VTCVASRTPEERASLRGGAVLYDAIRRAAPSDVFVRPVRCMSACTRPCTVAMSGPERFTLLFGDLDPLATANHVLDCFARYRASSDGFLRREERPRALQQGILARVPPPHWFHAEGKVP